MADKTINLDSNNRIISGYRPPAQDTVYPFRDNSGVVMKEFWKTIPLATEENPVLLKIDGLDSITEIDAKLVSGGFDFQADDYGQYKSSRGMLAAWAGQYYDEPNQRVLVPWAGGHNDSSVNPIIEFDLTSLKWKVLVQPSDPNHPNHAWSQAYRDSNSYSVYLDGTRDSEGKYNRSYILPDGRPPSQHTYEGIFMVGPEIVTTRNLRYGYNFDTGEFSAQEWTLNGSPYRPHINHYVFTYNGAGYGVLRRDNDSFGWYKIPDLTKADIVTIPSGSGMTIVGDHLVRQISDTKLWMTCYSNQTAIFHMDTETWEPSRPLTGDVPKYNYNQEMQAGVYIANWGEEGVMLRQFTYHSESDVQAGITNVDSGGNGLRGQWYAIDMKSNEQRKFAFTGYDMGEGGYLVGNKAFVAEVGGIKAMIYTAIGRQEGGKSETYIMRIA